MTTTDVEAMLIELDRRPGDETLRLILADAMADAGRDAEASILRGGEDGMLPVVVVCGAIEDRQEALERYSTVRVRATYVYETNEDGSPTAFMDRFGRVWRILSDDGTGHFALVAEGHDDSGSTAGVGRWSLVTPFCDVRFTEEDETFGVNSEDELVCLGGRWEQAELQDE